MWIYVLNFVLILIYDLVLKNKKTVLALASAQLFLILALRAPLLGVDNAVYMAGYEYISTLEFGDMLSRLRLIQTAELVYPYAFESGYALLNWFTSFLGIGFHGFLVLHALFCIFSVAKFVKRYSRNYCLSLVLFIALGFFTYQFGILRQTLALAIFLLSIPFIEERKPIKYFLLCLLAFTIHRVAIITVPLYFICKLKLTQKLYMRMLIILAAFFAASPLLINVFSFVLQNVMGKDLPLEGPNINAQFIIMILCSVLILIFTRFETFTGEGFGNNMLIWCFLFAIAVEVIGLYNDVVARAIYIPYVAIIALIPNVMESYRNRSLARIGKMVLIVLAFAFMLLQLHDDFINPYVFFFE